MSEMRSAPPARVGLAALIAAAAASGFVLMPSLGTSATQGWKTLEPSPLARTEVAAGKAGRYFWVVGGFGTGAAPSAEVARYDPRKREWKVMPSLPVTLNHTGVFGYRGRPYVFGGFENAPRTGFGPVSSRLFRFDQRRGEWRELTPAPVPRSAFAIGRIGPRVYVAGGATGTEATTDRVDVYDLKRDRWREGPSLEVPREHLAGAVAGRPNHRFFYALGGRDFYGSPNYRTVERFNPQTGRWRRLADMGVAHGGFGAVGVGRRVVAVGGEAPGSGPEGTIPDAEVYLPRRDRWRALPDLPSPRHGLGVVAHRKRVYAIEGGTVTFAGISNLVESLRIGR